MPLMLGTKGINKMKKERKYLTIDEIIFRRKVYRRLIVLLLVTIVGILVVLDSKPNTEMHLLFLILSMISGLALFVYGGAFALALYTAESARQNNEEIWKKLTEEEREFIRTEIRGGSKAIIIDKSGKPSGMQRVEKKNGR